MSYECKILADSISPIGARLTTFSATFPRIILAEVNTHRMLSRNAASSRAIPFDKMVERIKADPFIPEFAKNQKGMQAAAPLDDQEMTVAKRVWLDALNRAVSAATDLSMGLSIHKQWANRLLEPWMWTTMIISATDWANFFALRAHPAAQPEFQKIAYLMLDAYKASEPISLKHGEWHMPLLFPEDADFSLDDQKKICTGRCARVSYLTHEGKRDPQADIDLCARLAESGHWSPFEHVAQAREHCFGNFRGFMQYRKFFFSENIEKLP